MNYTGNELLDWIIAIGGNLFIVIAVIRGLHYWGSEKYGALAGFLIAGVFVACFIWLNDATISFLKFVATKILGA